ncbi:MAG: amino acid ABC transporter permease [Alphaproteobacteria bacterium]
MAYNAANQLHVPLLERRGAWVLRGFIILGLLVLMLWFLHFQLSKSYSFHWLIAFNFIPYFNEGLLLTIKASLIAGVVGTVLGLFIALARLSPFTQVRDLGTLYVHTFRNVPFYVFVLIVYFGIGRAIDARPLVEALGGIVDERLFWGVVALAVFDAAFISEIFRAGILSVHATQKEAARSMGMSATQAMRYVILPQAFRNVIPALTGELIALVKETALLFVISLQELTLVARELAAHEGNTFEFYTILAVYYLMLTLPLAGASHLLEKKLALNDRH